jgi:hypothetical protein
MAELQNLTKLVDLNVSYCLKLTDEGIEKGLCSYVNQHFRKLYLTALSLDERTVCCIAESLPWLIYLDRVHCFSAVTDTSIHAAWQHKVWLQCLKVTNCEEVRYAGDENRRVQTDKKVEKQN